MSIFVTKSFLPPIEEYNRKIAEIFDRRILTNNGPCTIELQSRLNEYLGITGLQYVTNGTIALQLALAGMDIDEGEVITTPFSYVATTSSIMWQRCRPIFVDIEPNNFTIDPSLIEDAITPNTRAIMAVHVFGYACDVDAIGQIAKRHNLRVIYDGAHAFGTRYHGQSLLSYGDVATCSFHATKLFHTIEGGAVITNDAGIAAKMDLQRRFGHNLDTHITLGINGKQSEFHAAMGLCNLNHMDEILAGRRHVSETYDQLLAGCVGRPATQAGLEYNYAYYPVLFRNEDELLRVFAELNANDIFPRRYFYPSLNTLPYVDGAMKCPVSEDIASRIACLPLYPGLADADIERICNIIKNTIIGD